MPLPLKKLIPVLFLLPATIIGTEIDHIFLVQNRFYSAVIKSLADAGVALPADIFSGLHNPALTIANHHWVPQSHGSVSTGYGRDTIFNGHIMPVGLTYSTSEGSLGLFYRFMNGGNAIKQHEITINIAGQIFPVSENQGAVDFGMNLRFEKMIWENPHSTAQRLFTDDSGKLQTGSSYQIRAADENSLIRDKRIILDMGFFQPGIWENADFGLVIRNLLGYVWTWGNTDTAYYDTLTDSQGLDSAIVKIHSFTGNRKSSSGWTNSINRTLSAGIVYHVPVGNNRLLLNFPLDLEMRGLFNRKIKNRYIFRGGMEAVIAGHLKLRLGYARAPGRLRSTWEEIRNINVFTGGAGLKISSVTLDFYTAGKTFGISGSFDY